MCRIYRRNTALQVSLGLGLEGIVVVGADPVVVATIMYMCDILLIIIL